LAGFLVSEVRTIERGTAQAKKEAKDQIPADRVKDAAALARELRWRVRLAAGYESDDEGLVRKEVNVPALVNGVAGNKRKRGQVDGGDDRMVKFKNFKPRLWETVSEMVAENDKRVVKALKPDGDGWKEQWVDWKNELLGGAVMDEADVNRRRDVIVKVRRTTTGVERQRVERVVEEWRWSDASPTLSPGGSADDKAKTNVDLPEDVETKREEEMLL
jgi:F-box/leucine-rich repeat protein 10/11